MEKLEGVREELEELDEIPAEELQAAVKKQVRRLWIVLLSVGAVILILAAVYFFVNQSDERDYKAEYLWQQEH